MRIYEVAEKKKYLPLLLLGDEQESMIEKYLDKCKVYHNRTLTEHIFERLFFALSALSSFIVVPLRIRSLALTESKNSLLKGTTCFNEENPEDRRAKRRADVQGALQAAVCPNRP